jgi:hypothetical protein
MWTVWAGLCSVWGGYSAFTGVRENGTAHLEISWLALAALGLVALPVFGVLLASEPTPQDEAKLHRHDAPARRHSHTQAIGRMAIGCILISWPVTIAYMMACVASRIRHESATFELLAATWFVPSVVSLIVGIRAAMRGARASRPLVMAQGIAAIASGILLSLVLAAMLAFG